MPWKSEAIAPEIRRQTSDVLNRLRAEGHEVDSDRYAIAGLTFTHLLYPYHCRSKFQPVAFRRRSVRLPQPGIDGLGKHVQKRVRKVLGMR